MLILILDIANLILNLQMQMVYTIHAGYDSRQFMIFGDHMSC